LASTKLKTKSVYIKWSHQYVGVPYRYINGIQLAKFGLLIDKTSSIYTKVRLRALGSVFFICLLVWLLLFLLCFLFVFFVCLFFYFCCWSSLSIIYLWAHFQLINGIPMGTRCAPHLAVPVLYSNEADFMQNTYKRQTKQKRTINF
jgi:hypothetical protein